MKRYGILFLNIGSPKKPNYFSVASYLKKFLSDPRILNIPYFFRILLVYTIIVPFRSFKVLKLYSSIYSKKNGFPLTNYSLSFAKKVQAALPQHNIGIGLANSEPSIHNSIQKLTQSGCDEILLFPLFPQYAASTVSSVLADVYKECSKIWDVPKVRVIEPFFSDNDWILLWKHRILKLTKNFDYDHILFSYHGLPLSHLRLSDKNNHCTLSSDCCFQLSEQNKNCYGAQCYNTTEKISASLKLPKQNFSTSFQSRLGPAKWLSPATSQQVVDLAKSGIKKLIICCPSFVTDCLETLEEIQIQIKEEFIAAGGEDLILVPSLNDSEDWINWIQKKTKTYLNEI